MAVPRAEAAGMPIFPEFFQVSDRLSGLEFMEGVMGERDLPESEPSQKS